MSSPWVPLGCLAVLLMLCLPATGAPSEGGVDPRIPSDLYEDGEFHPYVAFTNHTFEVNTTRELTVNFSYKGVPLNMSQMEATIILDIYGWAMIGTEEAGTWPIPLFQYEVDNDTVSSNIYMTTKVVPRHEDKVTVPVNVLVPSEALPGFYRVSVNMSWTNDKGESFKARSMGTYESGQWSESIKRVRDGGDPIDADYLVSEAGFNVVPRHFRYVSQPNKVPDFGDFTTPVIRPGGSGRYNFTVTNRYDLEITDVTVTVEFYMWATIEDSKPIERIAGTPPRVKGTGAPSFEQAIPSIGPGASTDVVIHITTSDDTDKGTYFVRHSISFQYDGQEFSISSRGFFTWDQWEGFDYSNLYYQLDGSAGIVPDSSFSVKDPVPLWPLATLIALCVLFGALAVVFYLAEEHGDQYPRLKRGLQTVTGRWEQRKRLMQQRMDELRGDDGEPDGEGDRVGDGDRTG